MSGKRDGQSPDPEDQNGNQGTTAPSVSCKSSTLVEPLIGSLIEGIYFYSTDTTSLASTMANTKSTTPKDNPEKTRTPFRQTRDAVSSIAGLKIAVVLAEIFSKGIAARQIALARSMAIHDPAA